MSADNTETQQLQKGVFLKIERVQQEYDQETGDVNFLSYFTVENKLLTDLYVEIDFTGSDDIIIENKDEKDFTVKLEKIVHAESTEPLASIKSVLHSSI